MSVQISRIGSDALRNAGFEIIGVIETPEYMNGNPVSIVTGFRYWDNSYVTWRQGWYPLRQTRKTTIWGMCYESGHYFQASYETPDGTRDARTRAFRDMMIRAGLLSPDQFDSHL